MYGLTVRTVRVLKSSKIRILVWTLAVFLIGWTLVNLPLSSIKQSVLSLTLSQWFAWIGVNVIIIWLGTKRWHRLLSMLKGKINFTDILFIRQAGQSISFVTPGPQCGGEPLQVYWLCRNGIMLEKALLSIGLDRCYELVINFTVLLMCVFFLLIIADVPFIKASAGTARSIFNDAAVLACALLVAILWVLTRRPTRIANRFYNLLAPWMKYGLLKKLKNSWRLINGELSVVIRTQKLTLINAAFISFLAWVALLGEFALLLQFLNIDFDVTAFLLILISMRLALLLPIPGGVGTLEASVFWSFHYLQLPDAAAIGLIALMRLRDIIILLLGLYCLRKVNNKSSISETTSLY
jgi:uncharacterized protein (TIRG00374 family)